jgi:protein gp37
MGKETGIEWADSTFNTWWGCVEVSPACDNCYARTWDARFSGITSNGNDLGDPHWGKDAPRKFFGDKHWSEPAKWNRAAAKRGGAIAGPGVPRDQRWLVFCSSMADVFESGRDDLVPHRLRLWRTIAETPYLTWLLLTKRPQNIARMLPGELVGAPNVWLGTTIESPAFLWRAEALCQNDLAAVRFVSMEPLLERTHIAPYLTGAPKSTSVGADRAGIDWVITGCESGENARETPIAWYQWLRLECEDAGIPFFLKQAPRGAEGITAGKGSRVKLKDGIIEAPYLDGIQHIAFPGGLS